MSAPGLPANVAAARRYDGSKTFARHLAFPSFRAALDARRGDESVYVRAYSGGRRQADWTFADYERRVRAFAHRLDAEFGLKPGDRVLTGLANSGQALVVYGALLALGAVPVPVNPAEKAEFLDFVAADCTAVGIVHDALLAAPIPERLNFRITITGDLAADADDGWAWDGRTEPALADPALIIYTSGTTGRSKGVVLDHGNLLINVEATRRLHAMAPGHVHMTVLPLFHVNAFCFSFLATLYSGARLVLNRGFFPPDFWRIAETEGVNVISAVPPVIRHLADDRRDLGAEAMPAGLRYFVSAAAPLSADDVARFRARYGLRIVQAYGLSETVNFSLTVPPRVDDAIYDAIMGATPRPSAGAAVFGNEVEVMGEDGKLLGEDAEGEIVIRGWNVMQGYHANPEGNAAAFAGGWFHTGDKGLWRTAGGVRFVFITGRLKETVKRGGEAVSLVEIDEALRTVPGLEQCVAVGFPNRAAGEEIGLFVVPGPQTPEAEHIVAICRERLPVHRAPKVVVFGKALPQTATGKIQRLKLTPLFAEFADRTFS